IKSNETEGLTGTNNTDCRPIGNCYRNGIEVKTDGYRPFVVIKSQSGFEAERSIWKNEGTNWENDNDGIVVKTCEVNSDKGEK
ncbi:1143_t:CDS:2, partial [Dentiscutata heterogama]